MIGNGREVETRLLGTLRIAYQVGGTVLLGHELSVIYRRNAAKMAMRVTSGVKR